MNPDRSVANREWVNSWPSDRRASYLKWLENQPSRKREWLKSLWPPEEGAGPHPCRRRCGARTDEASQVCADCALAYFRGESGTGPGIWHGPEDERFEKV